MRASLIYCERNKRGLGAPQLQPLLRLLATRKLLRDNAREQYHGARAPAKLAKLQLRVESAQAVKARSLIVCRRPPSISRATLRKPFRPDIDFGALLARDRSLCGAAAAVSVSVSVAAAVALASLSRSRRRLDLKLELERELCAVAPAREFV